MEMNESPLGVVARYQQRPPIDLDGIAHALGVRVYQMPLGSGVSGQIMRDKVKGGPSGFAIYVNSSEHPNRRRFTFAHELAHFILHRDLIETGVVDDTMYRSAQLSDHYEVQANRMAADILMPVRLVKVWRVRERDLTRLAMLFGVSAQAMQIRLNGIDTGAVNRAS
ncbi:ImmA/IrrE family metallo-endopeptidase [Bradyrhizobium canariense]|nr:ImmA/IrrE family metallo-endopeptidase [Bradyrhizobium canariense]